MFGNSFMINFPNFSLKKSFLSHRDNAVIPNPKRLGSCPQCLKPGCPAWRLQSWWKAALLKCQLTENRSSQNRVHQPVPSLNEWLHFVLTWTPLYPPSSVLSRVSAWHDRHADGSDGRRSLTSGCRLTCGASNPSLPAGLIRCCRLGSRALSCSSPFPVHATPVLLWRVPEQVRSEGGLRLCLHWWWKPVM